MSRPLRLEFPGALWHVTSRGNERRTIFRSDQDRERFVEVLARAVQMYRWRLHAYVLMGNHYHLLVETPEPNLGAGMRQLNGIFSQWFNRRHRRVGHVMQGRYKAVLVQRETHLLELARYVVLNPVRAGLVRSPREWTWSSYRATAGMTRAPEWLEVGWLLDQFGAARRGARERYRVFVSEGRQVGYQPWEQVRGQVLLGDEAFCEQVAPLLEQGSSQEVPRRMRDVGRPSIEQVMAATCRAFGVRRDELARRGNGPARAALALVARETAALPIREIAAPLGIRSWSASHLASKGRELAASDRDFEARVARMQRWLEQRPPIGKLSS